MKLLSVLIALAALVLGVIALRAPEPVAAEVEAVQDASAPYELTGEVPADHLVRTFTVEGMCCGGCAKKLHTALVAVEGVTEAAVDPVRGRAQAVVPEGLATSLLQDALSFDDYVATPQ